MALTKENRLSADKEIKYILRKGKKIVTDGFVFLYIKSKKSQPQFAFIASKKVGNSVERNRAKRVLKALVYKEIPDLTKNVEGIFVSRMNILTMDKAKVEEDIKQTFSKIDLITPNEAD